MRNKSEIEALYTKIHALVNHEIHANEFLRDVYIDDMTELVYSRWLGTITQHSTEQDIIETAAGVYDDLHKMNLFMEMMHMDEFDNFLVFIISSRFVKELSHIPAMSDKNEYDFSEQISDFVWETCRKSDAYMLQLESEIARNMSKALQLRFYGQDSEKIEEVTKFIEEYYHVEQENRETVKKENNIPKGDRFRTILSQIKEKRKAELTLNEMSKRCGISIAVINAYLSGGAFPPRDNVFKLAYGLKLSQQQLNDLLDALDKDLKDTPGFKSFRINQKDQRDMFLYTELPKRIPIEELNLLLIQNCFATLEHKTSGRKTV